MNKVYLLTITKGQWDSHHEIKLGVFDSIELAEEAKEKTLNELVSLLNKYTQDQIQEFESALLLSYEEAFYMDADEEIEYSEELIEYLEWPFRRKMDRFNIKDLKIEEYEINHLINLNTI